MNEVFRESGLEVDAKTSARLGRIPQRDTSVEVLVRKLLHADGIRYRIHNRDLPGSPDVANRSQRWAIFVHGCFWHHHEGCPRATIPKRNRKFWLKKFDANRNRDRTAVDQLRGLGFRCFVVWECQLRCRQPEVFRSITEFARNAAAH